MKSLRGVALAVVLAAQAAHAQAACPPAKLVLSTIREANSVQVLRLGSRNQRDMDWQSDDPDVFLGYEVLDSNPLLPAEAAALARALAATASYDCKAPRAALSPAPNSVDVGFVFHSDIAHVRAVLYLNEREVELEFVNGAHTRCVLSATAFKRIEVTLDAIAVRTAGSRKAWNERMGGHQQAGEPPPGSFEAQNGVDVMPVAITRVPPKYPTLAREAGVDGTVITRALIDPTGVADSVMIIKSIPMLDDAAKAAVRQWRFSPAQKSGRPASAWLEIPVKFSLH